MRKTISRVRRLPACEQGLAALEFALLAPALLLLAFAVIVYSLYFSAVLGVRNAASDGARAAMAGLSVSERTQLAEDRAKLVMDAYASLLGNGNTTEISTASDDAGTFTVSVAYDISKSPIMRYAGFLPMPSTTIKSSVVVTNGSY